jgi:hypothetical protein
LVEHPKEAICLQNNGVNIPFTNDRKDMMAQEYWTNVEVVHIPTFLTAELKLFFQHIDATGNIYQY